MWIRLLDVETERTFIKSQCFMGCQEISTTVKSSHFPQSLRPFRFLFASCCHRALFRFLLAIYSNFPFTNTWLSPTQPKMDYLKPPVYLFMFYGSECLSTCFKNKPLTLVSQACMWIDGPHCGILPLKMFVKW